MLRDKEWVSTWTDQLEIQIIFFGAYFPSYPGCWVVFPLQSPDAVWLKVTSVLGFASIWRLGGVLIASREVGDQQLFIAMFVLFVPLA